MLDLGHSHPDFTYSNDLFQARWTLWLAGFAAMLTCALILAVLRP